MAMPDWMPIETAPKDGDWIVGLDDFVGPFPVCWCDTFKRWETPDQNFSTAETYAQGEWFACAPTHWQPFPAPPREMVESPERAEWAKRFDAEYFKPPVQPF